MAVLVVNAVLTLAFSRGGIGGTSSRRPPWLPAWLRDDDVADPPLAERRVESAADAGRRALYATFVSYPFVLNRRAKDTRAPNLTAVLAERAVFHRGLRRLRAGRPGSRWSDSFPSSRARSWRC
jgi:hypothetical protein